MALGSRVDSTICVSDRLMPGPSKALRTSMALSSDVRFCFVRGVSGAEGLHAGDASIRPPHSFTAVHVT